MHTRQIARTVMTALFVAACVTFFGACVTIERAHAQTTNPSLLVQSLLRF